MFKTIIFRQFYYEIFILNQPERLKLEKNDS